MATNILSIGTNASNSADQVIAEVPQTVFLRDSAGPEVAYNSRVNIFLKDAAGQYFKVGTLSGREPVKVINSPGTYRFSRVATGASCGVDIA